MDLVDCYDWNKWQPATIISKGDLSRYGLSLKKYTVGFRVYPDFHEENFPDYEDYFEDKRLKNTSELAYIGLKTNYDVDIYSNSIKIKK